MNPRAPALEAQSLNHWTAREVPVNHFFRTISPDCPEQLRSLNYSNLVSLSFIVLFTVAMFNILLGTYYLPPLSGYNHEKNMASALVEFMYTQIVRR